jgi:hypothetical protein
MELIDHVYIGDTKSLWLELNSNGRMITQDYFQTLDQTKFIQSTVGSKGGDIINPQIRSSKIMKDCRVFIKDAKYKQINIPILKGNIECYPDKHLDLIKYDVGDHFDEFHYDSYKYGEVATLLIFPPQNISDKFTGGELIFKINDVEHVVETSKFNPDIFTCVIFGKVLHKCTPILSGTRYVFKGRINAHFPNVISEDKLIKLSDIEIDISLREKVREERQKQIKEKELEIKECITQYYLKKTEYLMKKSELCISNIDNKNYDFNLVDKKETDDSDDDSYSDGDLDDSDIQDLYDDFKNKQRELILLKDTFNIDNVHIDIDYIHINLDKRFRYNIFPLPMYINNLTKYEEYDNKILQEIKRLLKLGCKITPLYITFEIEKKYDDFDINITALNMDDNETYDEDDYYYNSKDEIYFHKDKNLIKKGKLINQYSEYNDESGYDKHTKYECACLLIF